MEGHFDGLHLKTNNYIKLTDWRILYNHKGWQKSEVRSRLEREE